MSGNCSAGLAKKPPKAGPTTEPRDHIMGIKEKAIGWSSFCGTISATMVRIIPTIIVRYGRLEASKSRLTVASAGTLDTANDNSHGKAGSHTPCYKTHHVNTKACNEDRFSAPSVRNVSPRHTSGALREGKGGRNNSRPFTNIVLMNAKIFNHFRQIWKDGCISEGFGESSNS